MISCSKRRFFKAEEKKTDGSAADSGALETVQKWLTEMADDANGRSEVRVSIVFPSIFECFFDSFRSIWGAGGLRGPADGA